MSVIIKQVLEKKQLKVFIEFPNRLYAGVPWFVPKIYIDEMNTLSPDRNPAFAFSEAAYFLAYKDSRIVGRIAAIINKRANKKWNHNEVRYGWFDFEDDPEVSAALLEKVGEFGRLRGMDTIVGPLGFTDFDAEGMLVEGFDQISTMALNFNFPYYMQHMERMGYEKTVDWLEYRITIPEKLPDRIPRVAKLVSERYGFHVRKLTRKEVQKEGYGHKIFDLINECYGSLYNFTPLDKKMIDKYIGTYLGFVDFNLIAVVEDGQGQMLGFGIMIPSIVQALRKCGGKLFPFGWIQVVRSMYFNHEEGVELLLIGVRPEYRNKGILAMIFNDLVPRLIEQGFKWADSNAELETNMSMRNPWEMFDYVQNKRRRIYKKSLK